MANNDDENWDQIETDDPRYPEELLDLMTREEIDEIVHRIVTHPRLWDLFI